MIKHLLTLIWNQRNGNIWIFLELLLVTAMLWVMADSLLVDTYTYRQPIGVDTQHTYLLSFGLTDDVTEMDLERNNQATQDLLQLIENLRQCSEVEAVCLSKIATPYTYNRGWSGLMPVEDTASASYAYRVRYVDLEYFRVFKVRDKEGRPLYDQVLKNPGEVVLSETLDEIFFPEGSGRTQREVKWGPKSTESMKVSAVSAPLKEMDFDTYQPTYYYVWRTEQDFLDEVAENDIRFYNCLFRMKKDYSQQEMEAFLQQESERLQVGNVYVSSVKPISEYRADMLKPRLDNQKKKIAMVGFMLVNIFFGIVGTFWLRTQSRRAEKTVAPGIIPRRTFPVGSDFTIPADLLGKYVVSGYARYVSAGLYLVALPDYLIGFLSVDGRYDLLGYPNSGQQDYPDESGRNIAL